MPIIGSYVVFARAIAFFLTTAILGPISGDQAYGLRFFWSIPSRHIPHNIRMFDDANLMGFGLDVREIDVNWY